MTPTLFIYHNKETKKTKVLCESEAKKDPEYLKLAGWEHIITIHQAIEITKEAIAAITNSIIDLENQISAN